MKTASDVRSTFLNFFKGKGHEIVPSSPLVPQNDPSLMFTNSGMVQFKNCFLGAETRPYSRATTAQKSVRAGGKHNDLENVGYTARHHTFFEMLGNFSFGDYFKDDAIAFAWELVSKHLGLPRARLLVTVHSSDEEAAAIWRKVAGFPDDKIIRIDTNDNFWMMGDTGPCGPCSEIFIDQGDKLAGGPPGSPDQDGDRFLEFWNLVFMQFEQEPDGKGGYKRTPLPRPSIDTGMGLERTAAILQGKYSNYDIELLREIIEHSAELSGVSPDGPQAPSHRVIADHLRASAFLMADGVMPSNEGRGYVLRRIMRRGMRHAHLLGVEEPMMYRLVPTLLSLMGETYPELYRAQALVTETLKTEETRFHRTLGRGLKLLEEETAKLSPGQSLSGDVAFKLYDTFGFPLDLTQDALRAKGISVDNAGFDAAMERQKAEARKAWAGSGESATDKIWFELLDSCGPTEFLGYQTEVAEGRVLALLKSCHSEHSEESRGNTGRSLADARDDREWKKVDSLKAGEEGLIITNQTPFYGESGGQVGDTGTIFVTGGQKKADPDSLPTSERLAFSIIGLKDVRDVFDTLNFQHTAETVSFLSWPMTIEQAESWCKKSEAGWASKTEYLFLAREKASGHVVGCIGLHKRDDSLAEEGYWVNEKFQGLGYASEMVHAATTYAFENLKFRKIYSTVNPDNGASAKVLNKNGFLFKEKTIILSLDGKTYLKDVYELVNGVCVTDTKKYLQSLFIHSVKVQRGEVRSGDPLEMEVDHARRAAIRANHSATHLLHAALHEHVGAYVTQKGSAVDDRRLRFDINLNAPLTAEQISAVERTVNDEIRANTDVTTRLMPQDEAMKCGAMALFGEKYDEEVRVLFMGTEKPGAARPFSVELCGGTHVRRTGDIGLFRLVSDSALSAGVRRIEAMTGSGALTYLNEQEERLRETAAILKSSPAEVASRVRALAEEKKKLEHQVSELRRKLAAGGGGGAGPGANAEIREIGGVKFTARVLADFPPGDLKPMADDLKKSIGSGVVALVAVSEGKASLVVGVTDDLTKKISAVDLVRVGAEALGGKGGGGRPDMAQAGGPNAGAANDAVAAIERALG